MKKSLLVPAIIACSMMMSPVNANAFWLDVVKSFVVGGIKSVVMPKKVTNPDPVPEPAPAAPPAASKPAPEAPKASADPTPQDIYDALNKLKSVCQEIGTNIPCSVGQERGLSEEMARDKARAKARLELANTMGVYVKNNVNMDAQSDVDEAGIFKETSNYLAKGELKTDQLLVGTQEYMSYTYIDEAGTELNKGKKVYVTTVVMIMNKDLFKQAIEDVSNGKPVSEQAIKESKKGIVSILKGLLKKI